MLSFLSEKHKKVYHEFQEYVRLHVTPSAAIWDRQQGVPQEFLSVLGQSGYLGCIIPKEYGGMGCDYTTFGLLNEAFGFGSSSLTVLFTVQNMVAATLIKWGTEKQRATWLEPMANGEVIASFALTEPQSGSDLEAIETTLTKKDNGYRLNGTKKWITFAGLADLFLVFGKIQGQPMACLVEKNTPGVEVSPIKNMLGFKACHMATVTFKDVEIPPENIIGKAGFAFAFIAPYGLHIGRMSTAFSAAGLIRACLNISCTHAATRKASGTTLENHGTIRALITEMGLRYESAMLMCMEAVMANDQGSTDAMEKIIMAKYYSSQAAVHAANDTVQILGAMGCNEDTSDAARYYRDAKIMEIIEGTTQVLQQVLGPSIVKKYKVQASIKAGEFLPSGTFE